MNTWFSRVGGMTLALAAVVALAGYAQAADTYTFILRGQVTQVDKTNQTVSIATTYVATAAAKDDLSGVDMKFKASGAKFYKYDANLKKVRISLGNVPVQSEVVVKGTKRSATSFVINELTVNPNTFTMVAKVKDHDTDNDKITAEVVSSTYKEGSIKGKDVVIYYGGDTKFWNNDKHDINADELSNNEEKIKVTGTVSNGWKFQALTVIDGYEKNK